MFFKTIEEYYFNNDFEAIVSLWEKNDNAIILDYSKEYDDKILEAVRVSYSEHGLLRKSLICLEKQISLLPKLNVTSSEKQERLKYYLNSKMNVLIKLKKFIKYYKTLHEYIPLFGTTSDVNHASDIEKLYYKRFFNINKYFIATLLILVVLDFSAKLLAYPINSKVQLLYELLTLGGLIWVLFLGFFNKKIGCWFVKLFRFFFKPREQNGGLFKID